jgi:hypothetical protein
MQSQTVFVRWYRDILQGEVVENDRQDQLAEMVAVRIPVQGVRVTALFHPQHVYQSEAEAKGNSPIISHPFPKVSAEKREISRTDTENADYNTQKQPENIHNNPETDIIISQIEAGNPNIELSEGWKMIQQFKTEHWDYENNHLRIDALDDFYRLWKSLISPILVLNTDPKTLERLKEEYANYNGVLYVTDAKPSTYIVSDEKMEQLKAKLKQSLKPKQQTVQLDLFS